MAEALENARMTLTVEKSAGILLLGGFAMLLVGVVAAPAGAYLGPIDERLAIIDANTGQWLLSKVFDALAIVLPAVGFVTLSIAGGRRARTPSSAIGGSCLALAAAVGLVYISALLTDPASIYDRSSPAPIVLAFISLIALGVIAFGAHFLGGGYPRWAGLVSTLVGASVLVGEAGILMLGIGPEGAFALAAALYVAVVALGVVLIRS
jgi:hypothetical protein